MTESRQPVLRVLTPDATEEEIAALLAVLSALGTAAQPAHRPVSEWSAAHRKLRRALPHGPGGWRASALPR
jgi:hypothetical protein